MAWEAIIQDVQDDQDPRNGCAVAALFTDGVSQKYMKTLRFSIDATDDDIKRGIGNELKLLERREGVKRDKSALVGVTLVAADFPDPPDDEVKP